MEPLCNLFCFVLIFKDNEIDISLAAGRIALILWLKNKGNYITKHRVKDHKIALPLHIHSKSKVRSQKLTYLQIFEKCSDRSSTIALFNLPLWTPKKQMDHAQWLWAMIIINRSYLNCSCRLGYCMLIRTDKHGFRHLAYSFCFIKYFLLSIHEEDRSKASCHCMARKEEYLSCLDSGVS